MISRFFTSLALLLAVILIPYWVYLPLIALAIIYFRFYWEGVVLGLVVDMLYGAGGTGFIHYPYALVALAILLLSIPLRTRLRFNA